MKFKELMIALHKVKTDAESRGLKQKDIHELDIVDVGILGEIQKINLKAELAQAKGLYCLLIKKI